MLTRHRAELLGKLRDNVGRLTDAIPRRAGNAEVPATALQQGLWFIAGGLSQCRINSKYLALQIKATEIGKLGPL